MPDITMCLDHTCPERRECYRYRAIASIFRQSWARTFRHIDADSCMDNLPLRPGSTVRTLEDCDSFAKQEASK